MPSINERIVNIASYPTASYPNILVDKFVLGSLSFGVFAVSLVPLAGETEQEFWDRVSVELIKLAAEQGAEIEEIKLKVIPNGGNTIVQQEDQIRVFKKGYGDITIDSPDFTGAGVSWSLRYIDFGFTQDSTYNNDIDRSKIGLDRLPN